MLPGKGDSLDETIYFFKSFSAIYFHTNHSFGAIVGDCRGDRVPHSTAAAPTIAPVFGTMETLRKNIKPSQWPVK
jgi:hypothetical protein